MRVVQELLLHWLGVKESVAPELPLPRAELLGHFHAAMQVGASPLIEARIYLDDHMKPWNLATFVHKTLLHNQDSPPCTCRPHVCTTVPYGRA